MNPQVFLCKYHKNGKSPYRNTGNSFIANSGMEMFVFISEIVREELLVL